MRKSGLYSSQNDTMRSEITHRKLVEDLAKIKCTSFFEVPLGSVWDMSKTQIADVININPSYTRFLVDIFEVKVTRADFLSDIRTEKWKGYLEHCNRFYFAAPKGIIKREDLPEEAGLIVFGEKGWVTIKAPRKREVDIPYMTLLSMIFKKKSQDNFERRYWISRNSGDYWSNYNKGLKKILNKRVKKALEFYDKHSRYINIIEKYHGTMGFHKAVNEFEKQLEIIKKGEK